MDNSASTKYSGHKGHFRFRLAGYAIILFFAIFAVVGGFLYFNLYLPTGTGPAGPNVPAEPFAHIWSERKVLLLGIGDSITAGFGVPKDYSYFERLVKNPENDSNDMLGKNLSKILPNLTKKNIAVSGSTSLQHLERQIKGLKPEPANVFGIVVMTTGGNDLIHNYGRTPPEEGAMYGATLEQARPWIANFEKRLDEMITAIGKAFPGGCHIFLANIYDPTDGKGTPGFTGLPKWPDGLPILSAYNDIIRRCDEKYDYVHLVNIHDPFLGHGINCRKFWGKYYRPYDPHFWYALILEDPNTRGYDAVRRLFLLEIIKAYVMYPNIGDNEM
jgi:lysophospholipase L1-like esterase